MEAHAQAIWSALDFRKPMMLRNIEPLSEQQMRWRPAPQRNSIAWHLWHIAEVEDNWIRALVTGEPPHFPFGVQVRAATDEQYPPRRDLLAYLHEVRAGSRQRLERTRDAELDRAVEDPDFGTLTVMEVWAGVVTSFAWHAGQVALTAKLMPDTPVTTQSFGYWKHGAWGADASGGT